MTKKEVEEKSSQIKTNIPNSAKKLSNISEIIFGLGIAVWVICVFVGLASCYGSDIFTSVFILIISAIIGAIIFLTYWILSLILEGFSEMIKNTYKSAEYNSLQVEMLAENVFKETNGNMYNDSLPKL